VGIDPAINRIRIDNLWSHIRKLRRTTHETIKNYPISRFVLILLGCSNQQKSLTHEISLTADLIKNTKDENLEEAIVDHIHTKMNEDFSNQEWLEISQMGKELST